MTPTLTKIILIPAVATVFAAGLPRIVEHALTLKRDHDYQAIQKPSQTFTGTLTWYGIWKTRGVKYDGQGTASGVIFRQNRVTFAAPVETRNGRAVRLKDGRYKPVVPFGTLIRVSVGKRSVTGTVTDTCIGGTWDTSEAGMKGLGFKSPMQKVRGVKVEVL